MTEIINALPAEQLEVTDWSGAARFLEQSLKAGNQDPHAFYLLAMCYKHQGRNGEARQALAKIADADANVLLQRGVLAFAEQDFALAGQEFAQSWEKEPGSYPAAYNLVLTLLCQGEREACARLIGKVMPLAPAAGDQRFLSILQTLLLTPGGADAQATAAHIKESLLGSMAADEEARLVAILGGLGSFDVVYPLLTHLVSVRPTSEIAHAAYFEVALLQGKLLMDRGRWDEAQSLLGGLRADLRDRR